MMIAQIPHSTQPTKEGMLIASIAIALIALILCFLVLRWKK